MTVKATKAFEVHLFFVSVPDLLTVKQRDEVNPFKFFWEGVGVKDASEEQQEDAAATFYHPMLKPKGYAKSQ